MMQKNAKVTITQKYHCRKIDFPVCLGAAEVGACSGSGSDDVGGVGCGDDCARLV